MSKKLTGLKIALIRGDDLNKFEMQNYEPLVKKFDLTAYTTHSSKFGINEINIPIKKLHSPQQIVPLFPLPFRRYLQATLHRFGYESVMFGLERELADKDIAHVAEVFNGYSYQAIKTKEKQKRLKVVVTVWENIPLIKRNIQSFRFYDEELRNKVVRNADLFMAVTERAKRALILEGVEEERIRVVSLGVDLDRFKPTEKNKKLLKTLGLANDNLIILYVGRLTWEKGVYDLLYAVKMIFQDPQFSHKKIKLLYVGSGNESNGIAVTARILGIASNVKIIGHVPYREIHEFYNVADIFVLPSIPTRWWQEQFGMVLVEAMASGKAVISTLSGSIPEVVGDCGLLIQPCDPMSLYYAIKKFALDDGLRKEMGRRAMIHAQRHFDRRYIAIQIGDIYESLI
jgi:glycosyltransferase involved in cell wall biosynthesis